MGKKKKRDYTIKSVVKALRILEHFKKSSELGVTELSRELDIPKSSIYHFLATLEGMGYIEQNPKNGKYRLGLKVFELGSIMLNRMELRSKAQPTLQRLSEKCQETVHLVIYDRGRVVYIDKIEGSQGVQINSQIGKRLPAYCTGVGKVLLAYLEDDKLTNYIDNTELTSFTLNTITDPEELKEELTNIRQQGYGMDDEEFDYGLKCIAAPINDYTGEVKAALSISGPAERINRKGTEKLIQLVMRGAEEISHNLGYNAEISL